REENTVINSGLAFMLSLSNELIRFSANEDFHSFWARNAATLAAFKSTTKALITTLEKTGRVVSQEDFNYLASKNNIAGFANTGKPLSESEINLCLEVSKNLDRNIFNEVGLAAWSDIRPKGVRDKAYLVLKRAKDPRHFSEIAQLINSMGLGKRKANVQTVHNELIKDDRFVLVGRGMYALAEWGYKAGTVKDVLIDILRNARSPMPKETILAKVRDARLVKENTILLNLQDSKTFVKNSDGTYTLK
ncbi:MAG TPA: winged helix-turn-helix domain-containing protein, partial [Candidatus Paceibacterota bacterium]|nr:winged helix-turn-helix domain-containing protein [Candidatus Paceibacterota bacterium]